VPVQADDLAEHLRVGAEPGLPHAIADYRNRGSTFLLASLFG